MYEMIMRIPKYMLIVFNEIELSQTNAINLLVYY